MHDQAVMRRADVTHEQEKEKESKDNVNLTEEKDKKKYWALVIHGNLNI